MEKKGFDHSKKYRLASEAGYSENGIVSKRIIDKKSGTVTLFSFDREQRLSEHSAPYDAMVQVLEGRAEISIGSTPYSLEEGEMIILPANIPHAVYAVDRFKMLLTMIRES